MSETHRVLLGRRGLLLHNDEKPGRMPGPIPDAARTVTDFVGKGGAVLQATPPAPTDNDTTATRRRRARVRTPKRAPGERGAAL